MLSDYQSKIADHHNILIGNVKKLVPIGLIPKKIHCVLEFNQSQWMKQYVEFNTQKRIVA